MYPDKCIKPGVVVLDSQARVACVTSLKAARQADAVITLAHTLGNRNLIINLTKYKYETV